MTHFSPYSVYEARIPKLKPGFFLQIGDKFYQIVLVRNNRQQITLDAGAVAEPGSLLNDSVTAHPEYATLHGNLEQGRVVNIQYLALTTTVDILFRWGTEPLLSGWYPLYMDFDSANRLAPLQVDRWSYDREMRLQYVKGVGAQTLWVEVVEYEIQLWTKTPPKRYHKILANGQAVFVEAG